jgi:hypothetical protein
MYYLSSVMARKAELPKPPYNNLKSYFAFKKIPAEGKPSKLKSTTEDEL